MSVKDARERRICQGFQELRVIGNYRQILGPGVLLRPSHHPATRERHRPLPQGLGPAGLAAHQVRVVRAPRIVPDVAGLPCAPVGGDP
jgi:hypothetical protein